MLFTRKKIIRCNNAESKSICFRFVRRSAGENILPHLVSFRVSFDVTDSVQSKQQVYIGRNDVSDTMDSEFVRLLPNQMTFFRSPNSITTRMLVMVLISSGFVLVLLYDYLTECNASNYRIVLWTGESNEASTYNQSLPPVVIDSSRLYFNRIPKAASTSMLNILHLLSVRNNFTHESSSVYNMRTLTEDQQRELATRVFNSTPPASFDRHVHFVNFNLLGFDSPLFINMVRDPVERIISDYYYRRSVAKKHLGSYTVTPSKFWLEKPLEECIRRSDDECRYVTGYLQVGHMVPYFCGHHLRCMVVNDEWALREAKKNIDRYYEVVGVVEMLDETISVLEKRLPRFFQGASAILTQIGPHNVNPEKPNVTSEARDELKRNLTNDIVLYNYIKNRLLKQIEAN